MRAFARFISGLAIFFLMPVESVSARRCGPGHTRLEMRAVATPR